MQILRTLFTTLLAALFHNALAQPIALPPQTVEGFLSNGLHYIIKPNPLPQSTVEFRLVMKVGSLQENDDQLGGAHFLEHIATADTKHFPDDSMVDYFERQGMKYGRDINAFTGYDRTVYWFTVPIFSRSSSTIDTTLLAVSDILSEVCFTEERIHRERGVIVEELRSYDTHDPFYELKIGHGRYAQRMPLGGESDIQWMKRKSLKDFYDAWYAPQHAVLVVVGNVDAADMETRIKNVMSALPRHGRAATHDYPLGYRRGMELMELADTLNTSSRLELMIPHQGTVASTLQQAVEQCRDNMLVRAVASRLNAGRVPCLVSDKWYLADQYHLALSFSGERRDTLLAHVARAAAVMKHLATKGPQDDELAQLIDDARKELTCDTTMALSSKWCNDFIDYVIVGDRYIHNPQELEAVSKGIGQTTPADIGRRAKAMLEALDRHLLVAYTNHEGSDGALTKADVSRAWQKGEASQPLPFVARQPVVPTPCVPIPAVLSKRHDYDPSVVASQRTYADLHVHEVVLQNGLRILLRSTLDDDKRLQLIVLGRGGTAALCDSSYYRLKDAVAYMDMGGIEAVDDATLSEILCQQDISMNIGEDAQWHQLMITANVSDAQLALNLAYEKMHHPRTCLADFEESRRSELENWGKETLLERIMQHDTDRRLANCIDSLVGNVLLRRKAEKADLEAMSLSEMAQYYRRLYTNPQTTTIILTGNFDLEATQKAAIGTFARMELPDSILPISDSPVQPVRRHERQFDSSNESQSVFNYIFAGNYFPELQTTLTFKLMRDLLQQRLLQVLRERENIVYSPYSDLAYQGLPQRTYYFWLTIAVKNENTDRMKRALREIIDGLQQHPVSTDELNKLKHSFVVTRRQQLNDLAPNEWKNAIARLLKNGETIEDFDRYEETLDAITPESVRKAFCNYIDFDHCIIIYKAK